jgi:hypothetical protein
VHADRGQGIADLFELEGLDDRHHDFHVSGSRLGLGRAGDRVAARPD